MAIVVESVSTDNLAAGDTTVITKPTGLAVGDLMVAMLGGHSAGSGLSFATLSGWTLGSNLQDLVGGGFTYSSIQYKVATSGDVAASDFTFTGASMDETGGTMLRVSGIRTDDWFDVSLTGQVDNTANPSFSLSHTPAQNNVLYAFVVMCGDGNNASSPVINGTNPTWTRHQASSRTASLSTFSSVQLTTVPLTSISVTGGTGSSDWGYGLSIFQGITNATGSSAFSTGSAEFFAPEAQYFDVTTNPVTNTELIAVGNGTLDVGASVTVTEEGFVFSSTSQATNPGNTSPGATTYTDSVSTVGSFTDGDFLQTLDGYAENDTIYVRAFAYGNTTYQYGDEVSFTSVNLPRLYRWYPHGEGTINTVAQTGNQGNVYSLVKILPEMATVKHIDIRCLPTASTGATVIGTVKYYFNHSTTPAITKSVTLNDAKKGYDRHEINMPYVNAVQIEIEFNTTQTLGADDFHPYTAVVHYEPTNTASKDGG